MFLSKCLIFMLLAGVPAEKRLPIPLEKAPVEIQAEKVSYSVKKKKLIFEGNVRLTQKDLNILSDKAEATLNEKGETEMVVLTGNVKIVKGDLTIVAKKAEFFRTKGIVKVTGRPRVWKGNDYMEGDEIIYNLNSEEITVKNASITIQQEQK